jgi:hypothetical protein
MAIITLGLLKATFDTGVIERCGIAGLNCTKQINRHREMEVEIALELSCGRLVPLAVAR